MEGTVCKSHGDIHVNVLPLVNRGMKTASVDNGLGQGKSIQHDMDVAGIGSLVNLPGHVKRVVVPAPVGHDHIDNQLVYGTVRAVLPEDREIGRQGGDTVGIHPERYGHGVGCKFVATDKHSSRHAGKGSADTVTGDVFEIRHVRYRDPVTAYGKSGIEGYRPVIPGEFDCNVIKTVGVKKVRGLGDTLPGGPFRTWSRRRPHVQDAVGSVGPESLERINTPVKHGLRVGVDAQAPVTTGRHADVTSPAIGKLVCLGFAPLTGNR